MHHRLLVTVLLLFIATSAFAADRIDDLPAYLAQAPELRDATPIEKLKAIIALQKENRIRNNQIEDAAAPFVAAHMKDKSFDNPMARLETWRELVQLESLNLRDHRYEWQYLLLAHLDQDDAWKAADPAEQLTQLRALHTDQNLDFAIPPATERAVLVRALEADPKWREGDLKQRVTMLQPFIESHFGVAERLQWSLIDHWFATDETFNNASPHEQLEMFRDLRAICRINSEHTDVSLAHLLAIELKDVPQAQRGTKMLDLFAQLKHENLVGWSSYQKEMELLATRLHLEANDAYQKASPRERLSIIAELEAHRKILPFTRRDAELPVAAEMLRADPAFMEADAAAQRKIIDQLKADGIIHMFTVRKLITAMNVR